MKSIDHPDIDARQAQQIVSDLLARRAGYAPEWRPGESGADAAMIQVFARFLGAVIDRENQTPALHKLAFLDQMGVDLISARAARAPITFQLESGQAQTVSAAGEDIPADTVTTVKPPRRLIPDSRVPAGTRVVAPPPPGSSSQIIFETETDIGLASGKLKQMVSLWPGRDEYIDHSADFLAGKPIYPFRMRDLVPTPHALYLAHDTLLALSGESTLDIMFDLLQPGSEAVRILWEYWDGKVWRGFLDTRPECGETPANGDSTLGLTRSGRIRLRTECASASQMTIKGVESYWVRGRLDTPIPADPARILPDVDSVTLYTTILQPLSFRWKHAAGPGGPQNKVTALVVDASQAPLQGITVSDTTDGGSKITLLDGTASFDAGVAEVEKSLEVVFGAESDSITVPIDVSKSLVTFTLTPDGKKLDKAFADSSVVDLTKPFYPFGGQVQPGSCFYFSSQEAFSKAKAVLQLYVQNAASPQDQLAASSTAAGGSASYLSHVIAWEYWNGREWAMLTSYAKPAGATGSPDTVSPLDFTGTGIIELTVPDDMAPTTVNDQDGLWMRARMVSGAYGISQTVKLKGPHNDDLGSVSYVLPRAPAVGAILFGYTWQDGPYDPRAVLAYNDFQYADSTQANRLPGPSYRPYAFLRDSTPGLFLGFDKPLPVDRIGIFFDVVEDPSNPKGPALIWEYWDGLAWQAVRVDDETRSLAAPGIASLIGPDDMQPSPRFGGDSLSWLRARLREDGPPSTPSVLSIYPNTVWASQLQSIRDDPIATSNGQPNQVFTFRQIPVLPGQQIEVRESFGARANVEWRILCGELFGDPAVARQIEAELASAAEVIRPPLRLLRDRNMYVTEVWVTWEERPTLAGSSPADRHYTLEHATGRNAYGDGHHGRIPPLGAAISARFYQTGGGRAGNVAARAISQVMGSIPGLDKAFNPRRAEGGSDVETLTAMAKRGPQTLRSRERAIAAFDYETLAREANPSVSFARAIPGRDPDGRTTAGWATLIIIPQSPDPQPWPSLGLREEVAAYIALRATGDLAATAQIRVIGPNYMPIDVDATIVPVDPNQAGAVETAASQALLAFLHPLTGGPDGDGWTLGRDVYLSDVAAVLEAAPGVDHVDELALLMNGVPAGTVVTVGPERIVAAGDFRLRVIEGSSP